MKRDQSYYLGLITSQYSELPKFTEVIRQLATPFTDIQALLSGLPQAFDLDTATGDQLDVVGEWIGLSRTLPVLVTGIYFAWDDTTATSFDNGVWQGPFDPDEGLVSMGDDDYRRLLKTKIRVNYWDGSLEELALIWNEFLPSQRYGIVVDNQDMTLSLGYEGAPITTGIGSAVLTIGLSMIKPAAVRIREVFFANDGEPLFAWDDDNGWDAASWSALLKF